MSDGVHQDHGKCRRLLFRELRESVRIFRPFRKWSGIVARSMEHHESGMCSFLTAIARGALSSGKP